jgi:hypothetical protein
MTVAQLGLAVESSSVVAATPALDRMTAASQKAEAAAGGLARASSGTSGAMKQLMSVVQSIERDLTVLVNRSLEAGSGLARVGNTLPKINQNAKMMGGSFSGLAAQFQDIGVTAAMGMNPMIIALQQGTQIAGQMEMAMANGGKATSVFAQAFASLLSPVSLVVIGLTAVAAAGLQMVNWTAVAKTSLNAVADALVVIAPYAVAAAAGLALLYAPTLISGAASLIMSLGNVAKGIWGVAAAIYATVGLPVLLIAGFTAMAAAAIIWRDDLAKMLGFDIVQIAQDGINMVVGFFVGAFNAVTGVWNNLPAIFADIFTMAMNGAIDIVQNGINGIVGPINGLLKSVGLDPIATADLSGFKGRVSGAASEAGKIISDAFGKAQGTDYVGIAIKGIQTAASGAADMLHGLADGLKLTTEEDKKAAKEAKRQAEAYDDITRGAHQRIEASRLEMETLGMTTEQINAQKYAQELLNKAANDNIDLTSAQVDELRGLGAAMAAAEEATRRIKEVYDLGKQTFRGFFSDLKSGIEEGKGLWASLGDAAANALQKIADKALSMAADGIWDMIFGALKSTLFGGLPTASSLGQTGMYGWEFLGSAKGNVFSSPGLHAYANQIVTKPTVFPFAKGIGLMGEEPGSPGEAIMPLRRGPDGRLGVTAANSNAANQNVRIAVEVSVRDDGKLAVIARQEGGSAAQVIVRQAVPGMIQQGAPAAMAQFQQQRAGSDYRV